MNLLTLSSIIDVFSKYNFIEMYGILWIGILFATIWLVSVLSDKKYYTSSIFVFISSLLLLDYLGNTPVLSVLFAYKYIFLFCVPIYLIAGSIWGVFKWRLFVNDCFNEFIELKNSYMEKYNIETLSNSDFVEQKFKDSHETPSYINREKIYDKGNKITYKFVVRPYAFKHKALILSWMFWWPTSLIYTLCHDSIKSLFLMVKVNFIKIRDYLMERMESVSINKFKNIQSEIDEKNQEKQRFE